MPLNPPFCLRARFLGTGAPTGNSYPVTLTINTSDFQTYTSGTPPTQASYNGTNVAVGMYATNRIDGRVLRIKSISSQTSTQVVCILEDIDGINVTIDPNGLGNGGVDNNQYGYIFELNSNGLPSLSQILNSPTMTFPDSILGRFVNDNLSLGNRTFLDTNLVLVGDPSPSNASIATSSKGITLEQRANVSLFTVGNAVAYNGHMYVAVGQGTFRIATSTDGITWTGRTATNLFTLGRAIIWDGSRWIAGGENSTSFKLATSTDGITWTAVSVSFGNVRSLAWSPSLRLYVAGVAGSSNSTRLYTSSDLSTWTARTIPLNSTFEITQINTIVWNGSRFMLGGVTNDNRSSPLPVTTATSLDGITWTLTAGARLLGSTSGCIGLAHNGSRWVAVGGNRTDGSISYSDNDGGLWTSAGTVFGSGGDDARGTGVTWTGSSWVACGFSRTGTSYTTLTAISTDGATWTTYNQTSTFASPIYGIVSKHPYSFSELESRQVVTNRGSSLVPSIYQSDSQSTGIYFPSTNNVAISTQGLERMRITDTGSIEIGPPNAKQVIFLPSSQLGTNVASYLTIVGGSGSPDSGRIFFGDNTGWKMHFSRRAASTTTDLMTIQDNGNVGIGTSQPLSRLQVVGTIDTYALGPPSSDTQLSIVSFVPYNSATNVLMDIGAHSRTPGDHTNIYRYRLGFVNNTNVLGGSFQIIAVPTAPGTYGSDGTPLPRFTIAPTGNVGIGTTSPSDLLDVAGSISTRGGTSSTIGYSRLLPGSSNNSGIVEFLDATGTRRGYMGNISSTLGEISILPGAALRFIHSQPGQTTSERMRINSAGNVGIGTNDPLSILDVRGVGATLRIVDQTNRQPTIELNRSGVPFGTGGISDWRMLIVTDGAHFQIIRANSTNTITPFHINGGDGNVGIGRTNPAHTLDVNGTIRGNGSIVNVATNATAFSSTYNLVGGNTSVEVVSLTYTPKQTGNVKVIIEGNVEWYPNTGASNDVHSVYLTDPASTFYRTQRQRWNGTYLYLRENFITGDLNYVETITGTKTYRIVVAAGGGGVYWRNAHLIVSEISST